MLCLFLFLFHIDYTIYTNHVFIKRELELIIQYRAIWIPLVLAVYFR